MTKLPMPDLIPSGHPVRRATLHYLLSIIQFNPWPAAKIVHFLYLVDFNRDGYRRVRNIRLNGLKVLQSLIRAILDHLPGAEWAVSGAPRWDLSGGIARQPLLHGDGRQSITQQGALTSVFYHPIA